MTSQIGLRDADPAAQGIPTMLVYTCGCVSFLRDRNKWRCLFSFIVTPHRKGSLKHDRRMCKLRGWPNSVFALNRKGPGRVYGKRVGCSELGQ